MADDVIMDIKDDEDSCVNVDFYRKLVWLYLDLHLYNTALFWAEKVMTLTQEREQDVYVLAQAMHASKQYHRAAHLIQSRNLHETNVSCAYLAASSLREAKEYNEATQLLLTRLQGTTYKENKALIDSHKWDNQGYPENTISACIHLEMGRVYEAMDKRELAADYYKLALQFDSHCYDAFEALIDHQMLTAIDEEQLLKSIPFNKHCLRPADQAFVKYLYESKLNKYRSIESIQSSVPQMLVNKIKESLDVKVALAERHYYNADFMTCWKITQEVMAKDPYHNGCLSIYISCLVELKNSNDLFLLAHRLVNIYPENAISWYAVGCYYYVTNKSEPTRRYLSKATSLNKLFAPAWLAFGHSFALDNEHDQAMAAYFKAAQLMQGCHLPLLYIGLQNGLTNNAVLAEKFFLQALGIAPNDPFVLHEMGVIAFQSEKYGKAKKLFESALNKIKVNEMSLIQDLWEPLLNNLGHVYRKLQMYEQAIEYHLQAKLLSPNNNTTYAAIGFCELLMGKTQTAAESFHKALSLKRDDTFSTSMLNYVLDMLVQENKETDEVEIDAFDMSELKQIKDDVGNDETMESSSIMSSVTSGRITRRCRNNARRDVNMTSEDMINVTDSSTFSNV